MKQDTSFLDELNAVNQKRKLRLRYGGVALAVLLVLAVFGLHSISVKQVASNQKLKETTSNGAADINQSDPQSLATPTPNTTPAATSASTQAKQGQPITVSPPQPNGVVDKTAFIANSNQMLGNYGDIVSTVNFSSTDTVATKISRIKQAVALDKQYFSQVTRLRGQLVSAGVSSGKYLDLTNTAESAVSKVSVGLTFMNYWATDQSRSSDFSSGTDMVTQGATLLLQYSDSLKAL